MSFRSFLLFRLQVTFSKHQACHAITLFAAWCLLFIFWTIGGQSELSFHSHSSSCSFGITNNSCNITNCVKASSSGLLVFVETANWSELSLYVGKCAVVKHDVKLEKMKRCISCRWGILNFHPAACSGLLHLVWWHKQSCWRVPGWMVPMLNPIPQTSHFSIQGNVGSGSRAARVTWRIIR